MTVHSVASWYDWCTVHTVYIHVLNPSVTVVHFVSGIARNLLPGDKSWGSGNASPPLECRGEVPEVVWGRSSQKLTTSWYRSLSTRLQHYANCWITLKALYKHASCRRSTLKSFTFSNCRRTNVNLNNKKHKPTACCAAAFCLYSIVDCCVAFPVAITLFTIIDVTSWLVSHTIRYDTCLLYTSPSPRD